MTTTREKIIMVDDDRTNLTVAKNTLINNYDIITVTSGKKLFGVLEKIKPDIILLDVEMPEMSGYEVIKILKKTVKTASIPVIFLTALINPESEIKGLSLGAVDYIYKPFSQELLLKRIEMNLLLEAQRQELERYSTNLEGMIFEKTRTVYELQNAILKTVAELVESRDNVTGGHIERTQSCLRRLVNLVLESGIYTEELSNWDIELFVMSSQLHDVGKISVKDNILMKSTRLTDEEFSEMKKHAAFGREIIEKIEKNTTENAFLAHAKILAGSHHEKWDGSGYPLGIKGEEIPLQGRLMALVDVYDALTNERPYKKALSHKEAIEIIKLGLGNHFDPVVGEVFVKNENKFTDIEIPANTFSYKPKPSAQLYAILKTVSNIADIRGGKKNDQAERLRRYLKIFINVLLKHEDYKDDVLDWDIDLFLLSAQLHDIGKIAVSENLLNKTEKLTDEEFADMKYHADFGVKIIQQIRETIEDSNLLYHAEASAGSHHEKWDGSGYPNRLKGKEIPLQGRIMAIVDVYHALCSNRPHRDKIAHKEVVGIIKNLSGTQFDPDLVNIFLQHEQEFEMAAGL